MKVFLFLHVTLFCLYLSSFAQEYTEEQKKLQRDISTFLKEEGYLPEIDSKGNLMFKKEGNKYYILIDKRDEGPLYLSISQSYVYSDLYSRTKIVEALDELNLNKGVKVLCFEDNYSYRAEMYLVNAEHFKYTFYKLMEQLSALKLQLTGICNSSAADGSQNQVISVSIQQFFPIYGIILGKTTVREMKKMGYVVEKTDDGSSKNCKVKTIYFWDHNKDDVFESAYIVHSDYIPDMWEEKFGFKWELSYADWTQLLKKMKFTIKVNKKPETRKYDGRKTLSAEFIAISSDKSLEFDFDFNYGNGKNEGYSVYSKNSLYSINIRAVKHE